ncbi:MAG TPA: PilN domain-containing protein [Gammaproteobacteria bacterium]|nr:PilN domain-containing protein [Gammaproteobacteria bacterium]
MPRINLLPWRAELRQKRKKEFLTALLGSVLFAGLLVYGSKLMVQSWTSGQHHRNDILKEEIAKLDKQIADIKGLENQRERLLARMRVIDQLQRSRPEVVHLFDELVNAMPEGVNLTSVTQANNRIDMSGSAQSSSRVSALMRNIEASPWLADPHLDGISGAAPNAARGSQFQFKLYAQQVPTDQAQADSAGQKTASSGQGGSK